MNAPAQEDLPGDGPGDHQGGGQPTGEMAAARNVVVAVVPQAGRIVGVGGAGTQGDIAVIPRAGVLVLDQGAQGRAGGAAALETGLDLADIRFLAAGSRGILAGARRASCRAIYSSLMGSPAGRPSTTTPIAGPWLSPKRLMRTALPMLDDMDDSSKLSKIGEKAG